MMSAVPLCLYSNLHTYAYNWPMVVPVGWHQRLFLTPSSGNVTQDQALSVFIKDIPCQNQDRNTHRGYGTPISAVDGQRNRRHECSKHQSNDETPPRKSRVSDVDHCECSHQRDGRNKVVEPLGHRLIVLSDGLPMAVV